MLATGLALAALGACGQDTGYLYQKETIQLKAEGSPRPAFDLTESLYQSVTWFNDCPAAPANPPTRGPLDPVIAGAGPHSLYRQRLVNVPFFLMGKVCPTRGYDRDVVVMVGLSGAAIILDNFDGNTCQRFEALDSILNELPSGSRMGVTTFEEVVIKSSSDLFGTKAELYADLVGAANPSNQDVARIVCGAVPAGIGGLKNFNVAFEKGKELLSRGRANGAKKELYLLSDGYDSGNEFPPTVARQIRQEITTQGIAIGAERIQASVATLLLGPGVGDPTIVHEYSTNDRGGQPLRGEIAQAVNVARQAGSIAANEVVSNTLRIRPIGSPTWQTHDVMPHMSGLEYTLPSFILPIDLRQAGFELEGEYADTHGNRTVYGGRIEWADGPQ